MEPIAQKRQVGPPSSPVEPAAPLNAFASEDLMPMSIRLVGSAADGLRSALEAASFIPDATDVASPLVIAGWHDDLVDLVIESTGHVIACIEAKDVRAARNAGVDDVLPLTSDPAFLIAALVESTVSNRMLARLRDSEARVRAILETTVDGVITIDERGFIESFNPAAEKIFGYDEAEVVGKRISILMPEPYRSEHGSYMSNYIETGHRKIIGIGREVVGQRKNGTTFPLDLAVSETRIGNRRIFTGSIRDVTDRRRLEQEILEISDGERRRIGQDLHDGLGQMLTGTGLIARSLARRLERLSDIDPSELAEEVEEIAGLVREADEYARTLARGLVPIDLDAGGLEAALRRLAQNAETLFSMRCTVEVAGTPRVQSSVVATHLYRIAQEAVSNAARHGQAQHVRIGLVGNGSLRLRVHDDGLGFDPDSVAKDGELPPGVGLQIMQHRARIIGGHLEVFSRPSEGTTVACTLHHPDAPVPMGGEEFAFSLHTNGTQTP
ncbi:MAG: PAS domain S-box protein [Bacteroidota bacterium]